MTARAKAEERHPPHPNDWGPRVFTVTGFSAYRLAVPRAQVTFDVSRLRRERGELIGELTVLLDMPGARTIEGMLSAGDFNLSSVQARTTRAKHLAARALADDMDWEGWLSELCFRVIAAERTGAPAIVLSDAPALPPVAEFDLAGWTLPRHQPAILFGDGGSAKSYLALHAAGQLAQAGERVLYADWESDAADHGDRLSRLFPEGRPPVLYARCERPLTVEADRLRAIVKEWTVTYVVLDSAAYGCPGAPEAAETAIDYFRAFRSLGTGGLILAHMTKSEEGDKRPFGSSFWHNSARATWHAKRSNPDEDSPSLDVLLSQRKCNAGRLRAPLAFTIRFHAETTVIHRARATDTPEFAASLTTLQRLRGLVAAGPQTMDAIAQELDDHKPDTIAKSVRRGIERGVLVRFQDATGRELVGLKAK